MLFSVLFCCLFLLSAFRYCGAMVFYCNFQQITNCRMLFCCCPNCDFDLEMQNWYRGCCYFNGMVKLMRSQSIWSDLYMLSRNLLMTGVMLAGQL